MAQKRENLVPGDGVMILDNNIEERYQLALVNTTQEYDDKKV